MAAIKRPAFQFYPADWRKDPALRMCSVAARGLWMDMLCIMHESDRYGFLEINGVPIDAPGLAKMVGEDTELTEKMLAELEKLGVFSRRNNVIFSRRMVRDEALRTKRARAGKLGGNPDLVKHKDNPVPTSKDNPPSENRSKQKPTPSSSSSTSVSPLSPLPLDDNQPRKPRATPPPDCFEVTPDLWDWALGVGLPEDRIESETAQFLEHHHAKGSRFIDWTAAWRTWIRNAVKFTAQRRA